MLDVQIHVLWPGSLEEAYTDFIYDEEFIVPNASRIRSLRIDAEAALMLLLWDALSVEFPVLESLEMASADEWYTKMTRRRLSIGAASTPWKIPTIVQDRAAWDDWCPHDLTNLEISFLPGGFGPTYAELRRVICYNSDSLEVLKLEGVQLRDTDILQVFPRAPIKPPTITLSLPRLHTLNIGILRSGHELISNLLRFMRLPALRKVSFRCLACCQANQPFRLDFSCPATQHAIVEAIQPYYSTVTSFSLHGIHNGLELPLPLSLQHMQVIRMRNSDPGIVTRYFKEYSTQPVPLSLRRLETDEIDLDQLLVLLSATRAGHMRLQHLIIPSDLLGRTGLDNHAIDQICLAFEWPVITRKPNMSTEYNIALGFVMLLSRVADIVGYIPHESLRMPQVKERVVWMRGELRNGALRKLIKKDCWARC